MIDATRGAPRSRTAPPWSRNFVRIVTWNIERGLQLPKILRFLETIQADILLLQEVDLNARRTGYRDIANELAQALNLNHVFATEFQELGEGTRTVPAFHGMATLSPWPLFNPRIIRFRSQSYFWQPRWYIPRLPLFQRRLGGRLALAADAAIPGQRVLTYNLHLESRGCDELRLRQLNEVLADCRLYADRQRVAIGGDFNLEAGTGEAAAALHNEGFESPLENSRARSIDWIFASRAKGCESRIHYEVRASDHYPVSATIPIR